MPEVTRTYSRKDREESIYHYVPFDVPAGSAGVTITYRFTGFMSVVDLGIFDPFGFRGWTGSARSVAMISNEQATPGYLPGIIRPGTWFVALGLHRVDEEGTQVTVTWEIGKPDFPVVVTPAPAATRPPRRKLPARDGHRWFASDFHTHSEHSDGSLSIYELTALATRRGLEILAITDHNNTSHHALLPAAAKHHRINLMAGQEITTDSGHANALGEIEWVDFREATQSWLESTTSRGGLLSINHPLAAPCHWEREIPDGIPLTELWHSSWDRQTEDPIEWWKSNGTIPIGGSDFHRLGSDGLPGEPTTWIEIATDEDEVTEKEILTALSNGHVSISGAVNDPVIVPVDDEIIVDGGEGCTLRAPNGETTLITSDRQSVKSTIGFYSLIDAKGIYQSLCYRV